MSGTTGGPADAQPTEPVTQLRGLPKRYREALAGGEKDVPAEQAAGLPPEAVEEAAQARDLLDSTARRVERLLEETKPVGDETENPPPRRGHYNLDADVVLEVLDNNAERLARLAEAVPDEAADRRPGIRDGLQSITGELVDEAVTEGERRLRDARRVVDEGG